MSDQPLILIYHGDPANVLDRAIMDTTAKIPGDDALATHSGTYYPGIDITFDTTVWQTPRKDGKPRQWWELWAYRTGRRMTRGMLPGFAYALRFKVPRDPAQVEAGIRGEIARVNARGHYAVALLALDWILIRTRRFWGWVYERTHWAPFDGGSDAVCSMDVDRSAKDMGCDLWPGLPESLTVPGDFIQSEALERMV